VTTNIVNNKISPLSILKRISLHLDEKRKKDVKFVFFFSLLSSLLESVSIAMLIPFVSFFINPEDYRFNDLFVIFFNFFNITEQKNILAVVSSAFIFFVLLSGFIRTKYIKSSNLLIDGITSDFRIKIFKFLLNQNYSYYFKHGSNEILSNLSQKVGSFTGIIFSAINILNSSLICLAIMIILFVNEPFFTPIIVGSILLFFFIFFKIKSLKVLEKGQIVNINQNFMVDIFQNTIGYLPEMIIYNLKNFFLSTLSRLSKETAISGAEIRTISMTPRIYLETFVITFVVAIIFFSGLNERSVETNLSYLAILAFGAQKSLPLINNMYYLSVNFKFAVPTVNTFLNILDSGNQNDIIEETHNALKFKESIKFENISFQYDKNFPNILNNFNFNISKGEVVAIKGQTGSGKSTLANILAGLFSPVKGKILVDGVEINLKNIKNWQKNIAIVPQTVFLNDVSVLKNIAIALDDKSIDIEKVKDSAKMAQIHSFIESLPNKFNELVGERGVRLSGGQRQRIGIARALYRDAKLIILDEPTNALDSETERLVMDSITKLSKDITLVMISHSDTSLKYFDKIIDLDKLK
jgi:ABC-type multidrug transport system fused ATPase/permease subunit